MTTINDFTPINGQDARLPINEQSTLEEIQEFFTRDKFATLAGCKIVSASKQEVVCEMPITPEHLNPLGAAMGGAVFTLADFTMGVLANLGGTPMVAIDCTIRFMRPAKGTKLVATCTSNKVGRNVGFFTVDVANDEGVNVAQFIGTTHTC